MLRPSRPRLLLNLVCGGSLLAISCAGDIQDGKSTNGSGQVPGSSSSRPSGGANPSSGGPIASDAPSVCGANQLGGTPLHRLTKLEYDNTIRDLTGQDMNLAKEFAYDERAGTFAGNFFTPISEMQFAQYATAAEAVAEVAAANVPKFVPCDPTGDAVACEVQFIKQFGRKAYRRPLDNAEVAKLQKLFDLGRTGADFANGVRLTVQAMLQSPKFLYLVEGPGALTQHQVAARLSYFLWNSPPDPVLSAMADAGALGTLAGLRSQAARLLADPKATAMFADFTTQWLGLEELPTETKDATLYPNFDTLKTSMITETGRFVADVIQSDGGRLDSLLGSSSSVIDNTLATLYGASGGGNDWHKATLNPAQRSGLLTQAAFLSAHGAFDGSSPIRRGLAVRERVLCAPMPIPPPGADQNFPAQLPTTTTRQRFDNHRTNPSCASCHAMMDKLGYGFETYDGEGKYRTTENGAMVDDSGEILATQDIDGPFKGAPELVHKLATSKQVQSCMSTQWFRYAFARVDTDADKCVLDAINKRVNGAQMKMTDLLSAIVESDAFRTYTAVK
jgi:hypothetical protein